MQTIAGIRAAIKENRPALTKELLDRIEGNVTEKHQIEGDRPVQLACPRTTGGIGRRRQGLKESDN